MHEYTVFGIWHDGEFLIAGVVEGNVSPVDVWTDTGWYERYTSTVLATDPDDAEARILAEVGVEE